MKLILLLITTLFSFFAAQETVKLNGTYKLEYDNKYQLQSAQVTFSDSTFTKKMPDGLTSKGKLIYTKNKVTLKQNDKDNPIEINLLELTKDTMTFTTKSKTDLSMTINRGKMTKIK